jgi:SOS-response transcriptional repressor LexA
MRILFEEYAYYKDDVKHLVPDRYMQNLKDNKVSIQCVGYYYSSELDDSVFVLPKVFIKEISKNNDKAFGLFDPTAIINLGDKTNPLRNIDSIVFDSKWPDYIGHIFNLSTWIYRAIEQYRERHPQESITNQVDVLNVESVNGDDSQTLINCVLDLIKFNKEHKNLFTFIAKLSAQGHHKVNWHKTISKCQPFIQDGEPIYMEMISKTNTINPDEELIVLFFSVLDYLHEVYHFPIIRNLNYKTYPREIGKLVESGKGTRYLRKIRHKYFKDELVKLWNLLNDFFMREEDMKSKRVTQDYLLVKDFDRIFEDMIDSLISDDTKTIDRKMADQRDRKIVDHIYKYESLVRKDDVYYIGDSKYYKEGSNPADEAIYKQFTYARNVIQRNMDLLEPNGNKIYRDNYFDPITEGYNITPNFFIRGTVEDEDYDFDFRLEQTLKDGKPDVERMTHHKDRLFDRDTLLVLKYNISFLFVLSTYASNHADENLRRRIRNDFRKHVMAQLNKDYKFFKLRTKDGVNVKEAVDRHFRLLLGKVFSAFNENNALLMALEKETCAEVFDNIRQEISSEFEICDYNLIKDEEGVVYPDPKIVYLQTPVQTELEFSDDNEGDSEEFEIQDEVADEEKFVNFLPVYNVKAVCGERDNQEKPEEYAIGWIKVEGQGFRPNHNHFVVRAHGNSMQPKINDGDLCVFEWYKAGTREGCIVLTDTEGTDPDYDCQFTIKEYHSKYSTVDDEMHEWITLKSLNPNYEDIELSRGEYKRTYGIFKCVLR